MTASRTDRPGPSGHGRRIIFVCLLVAALAPPIAVAHGDLHEQIVAISQRIEADPANADLILRRAELHREHEQWPQAEADYDHVAKLAPDNRAIDLGRGKLYLAMAKPDTARAALDRVLDAQPTHVDALATRAQALQALGEHEAAAADYARAIENASSPEPDFYLGRAKSLSAARPARDDQALASLDAGIARLGKLPTLSLAAIELQVRRSEFDDALRRLDTLREAQPRQEAWLERRGDILMAAKRPDEAMRAWRDAMAALDALPPRLRGTGAMLELRKRLTQRLQTARPRPQ
ncbi:MAG: hypothetical protein A3E01_17655 [Gammaproteobacteria bacterium RIFCSPHIGHO2_12_FULL_63_22]|nr:MAG: hypothetical protein A3E01_17655 [Gammaproteobacteria bacterium RIFCSPHIGHO2_12_FULL_63_22]